MVVRKRGAPRGLEDSVPWPTAMNWFRTHGFKKLEGWTLLGHLDDYDDIRDDATKKRRVFSSLRPRCSRRIQLEKSGHDFLKKWPSRNE